LNRFCIHQWDGEGEHPPCPRCGGIQVKWVPKPVAIKSEKTKQVDRTVAQLTATYGDKDYRSPRRHERMAPQVNPSVVAGKTMDFTPKGFSGWTTKVPVDANGNPHAICAPTGVTAKLPIQGLEKRVPVSKASPSTTGSRPQWEARHNPPNALK
jgi:hypothetical protein